MNGKKPWRAAEIEALEEAGALGHISHQPIGTYCYKKRLENGQKVRCRVTIYPMIVDKLKSRWKERKQRKRHWFSPCRAAALVEENELSDILLAIHKRPEDIQNIQNLREAS